MNLLRVSKKLLTTQVKLMIYYAYFYSHLKYGILAWGHMASRSQLVKLQKLQDECLRLICGHNTTNPSVYKSLGILQVK